MERALDERPDGKRRIACDRVIGLARANARTLDDDFFNGSETSLHVGKRKATPEIDEGLRTCGLDFWVHLIVTDRGGRARSLRIPKHVQAHEAAMLDELAGPREVIFRFAGKADDDIG